MNQRHRWIAARALIPDTEVPARTHPPAPRVDTTFNPRQSQCTAWVDRAWLNWLNAAEKRALKARN